jgi:hypothetical protein
MTFSLLKDEITINKEHSYMFSKESLAHGFLAWCCYLQMAKIYASGDV